MKNIVPKLLALVLLLNNAHAGTVVVWGDNTYGQRNVPAGLTNVIAISANAYHTMALNRDGTVVVWGQDESTDTGTFVAHVDPPPDLTNAIAISAGSFHNMALRADGTVAAWGWNDDHECDIPASATNIIAIAAGHAYSIAVNADGKVIGWGNGGGGTLSFPAGSTTNVTAVAAGISQVLALKNDNTLIGWPSGDLGEGTPPPGMLNVTSFSTHGQTSAALTNGVIVVFGNNDYGQANVPLSLQGAARIVASCGQHMLAVRTNGTVAAWGRNTFGQTTLPSGLTNVIEISGGWFHSVALKLNATEAPVIVTAPQSQTLDPGQDATFNVVATGYAPLNYQWKSNGIVLAGQTTSSLTVPNVQPGALKTFTVTVKNAVGSASVNATLSVNSPPTISIQPVSKTNLQGQIATFTATVAGSAPLSYQWNFNNIPLADGTSSSLVINPVFSSSQGSYFLVVTNSAGSATSSTATLTVNSELIKPIVTMTNPINNARITNSGTTALVLLGKATDNTRVTRVTCQINSDPEQDAAMANTNIVGTATWSANVNMQVGTNIVRLQAFDFNGNASVRVTNKFFFVVTNELTLTSNGVGTLVGTSTIFGTPTNGAWLEIGRGYRITAIPGTDNVVSNWFIDGIQQSAATGSVLNFIMGTNTHIEANFVYNPLIAMAGTYSGLFKEATVTHEHSGFFTAVVKTNFTYTGQLKIDGQTWPFSGKFAIDGTDSKAIIRTNVGKGNLTLAMQVDLSGGNRLTGSVSDRDLGTWSADLEADRLVWSAGNPALDYTNVYTMLLHSTNGLTGIPQGDGYASITVQSNGQVTLTGGLPDSSALSQVTWLSKNGRWPLYAELYKYPLYVTNPVTLAVKTNLEFKGSLLGWISLTNDLTINLAPEGEPSWNKKAIDPTNTYYAAGFASTLPIEGSRYLRPPVASTIIAVQNISNNVALSLSLGNLASPIVQSATLKTNNAIVVSLPNPNKVSASVSIASGLFSGGFIHPAVTNKTTIFKGAVLQEQDHAGGSWLGPGESGSVSIYPY